MTDENTVDNDTESNNNNNNDNNCKNEIENHHPEPSLPLSMIKYYSGYFFILIFVIRIGIRDE